MSNKHRLTGHGTGFRSITIFLELEDHLGNDIQLTTSEPDSMNPTARKELQIDLSATHKSTLMGMRNAIVEELDSRTR